MRKIPKILRIIVAAISLSMGLLAFSFLSQWGRVNPWAAWQLGPNMAKMFAAFTVSAVVVVGFWLALAFVFGRFYCSAICPIGIMQDIIGSFSRWKKRHPAANYRKTRYAIALVAFGMMAGGSVLVFAVLDPFSIFGRMAIGIFNPALIVVENTWVRMLLPWQPVTDWLPIAVGAILPLAILIALVIWKKRIFCTAVCPVGTVLGVCSRRGVVRLGINENRCKGCGLCAKVCPVDCIDAKARTLDNERCVRCMNCIAACKLSAVCFTCKRNKAHKSRATDLSRRNFLMGGTLALTAAGAGYGLKSRTVPENRLSIYPPARGRRRVSSPNAPPAGCA
ncbi:MAG: 4Fe-4S binding protein [Alphaproteobacteria bacterium]|nr:4Fe-4S binding protein [Alphaproteobacteria bacterium]